MLNVKETTVLGEAWTLLCDTGRAAHRYLLEHPARTFTVLVLFTIMVECVLFFFLRKSLGVTPVTPLVLREIALVIGGSVAVEFAIWRTWIAERQSATAHRGSLNDRFQKGVEMLGNDVEAVRLGGIYALDRLAEEYPQWYYVQATRTLCAFVRYPTATSDRSDGDQRARGDTQAAVQAIGMRRQTSPKEATMYVPDLRDANLRFGRLVDLDLSRTDLTNADLAHAQLQGADLTDATLDGADISGAIFADDQAAAVGLTQAQLDRARAEPDEPPILGNAADAQTGAPLIWPSAQPNAQPREQ